MNKTIDEIQVTVDNLIKDINTIKKEPAIALTKLKAKEGYTFVRRRDKMIMGPSLTLGYDFSLGIKRVDNIKFYDEVLIEVEDTEVPDNGDQEINIE